MKLCVFLVALSTLPQLASGTTTISSSKKALFLNSGVNVSYGVSSNPAHLWGGGPRGGYIGLAPKLDLELELGENFLFVSRLLGNMKRYFGDEVSSIADQTNVDFGGGPIYYIDENWESGLSFNYEVFDGKINSVSEENEVTSANQLYDQPSVKFYLGRYTDEISVEAGTRYTNRRYSTDELDSKGKLFNGTYDEWELNLRPTLQLGVDTELALKLSVAKRKYAEKMAKFSDGNPSEGIHPLLETFDTLGSLQLKTRLGSVKLKSKIFAVHRKDMIFAAEDSLLMGIQQIAGFGISKRVRLTSEVLVAQKTFSNFRSDLSRPKESDTRMDWDYRLGTSLIYRASKAVKVIFELSWNLARSNYKFQNYEDTLAQTKMSLNF